MGAIGGKTVRRSRQKKPGVKVAGKSNEITAIPKLLEMLAIEGAIVAVELFVVRQQAAGFGHTMIGHDRRVDGDHGRIELRTSTVMHDVGRRRITRATANLPSNRAT